jgi:hypothetical protein
MVVNTTINSSSHTDLGVVGGEFSAIVDGDSTNAYRTFCLERNEFFMPGVSYNYTKSFAAEAGGLTGATDGKGQCLWERLTCTHSSAREH